MPSLPTIENTTLSAKEVTFLELFFTFNESFTKIMP